MYTSSVPGPGSLFGLVGIYLAVDTLKKYVVYTVTQKTGSDKRFQICTGSASTYYLDNEPIEKIFFLAHRHFQDLIPQNKKVLAVGCPQKTPGHELSFSDIAQYSFVPNLSSFSTVSEFVQTSDQPSWTIHCFVRNPALQKALNLKI